MNRLICLLLGVAMIAGLLQGCAGGQPEQTTVPSEKAAETTAATTTPETEAQTVHLRFQELEMTAEGETCRLYNGTAETEFVTFGSDNEAVATFDNGIVVCHGSGTAVVFAEYAGERMECTVTCQLPAEAPTEAPTEETTRETGIPEPADPDSGFSNSSDPVLPPPESFNVDSSFFDDAVFVGDSVSVMLSYYAADSGDLGNAQFLVKESYSIAHASYNSMYLPCEGGDMNIEDAIAYTGANKVFLMLGINDMVYMSMEDTVSNWRDVLSRIRAKCPGIKIYIESCTPIYTDGQQGMLTNERMDTLNMQLMGLADEYDATFLNIAPYLKDGTNGMANCYSSDNYVHLTYSGTEVWVKALKALITG